MSSTCRYKQTPPTAHRNLARIDIGGGASTRKSKLATDLAQALDTEFAADSPNDALQIHSGE